MIRVRLDNTKCVVEIFPQPLDELRTLYTPEFVDDLKEAPGHVLLGQYRHDDGTYLDAPVLFVDPLINPLVNAAIDAQIKALEARLARPLREDRLGDPTALARIQSFDAQIVALRAQRV
ncbi:MAG: hypothetical protein FD177_888 [Desulfovibrionaceae bacterium]|nr:MAG: hypothetical protein FD177_888 [Desulfovibrionaceae bacterium]